MRVTVRKLAARIFQRLSANHHRAAAGGAVERAVLGEPRLCGDRAGLGRAGARHLLQPKPPLHREAASPRLSPSRSTATWRSWRSSPAAFAPIPFPTGMDRVPEIARRYGLTVSLGCWISSDLEENEKRDRHLHPRGAGQPPCDRPRVRRQRSHHVRLCQPRAAERLYQARPRRAAEPHQGDDGGAMVAHGCSIRKSRNMSMSCRCISFPIGRAFPSATR